MSSELQVLFSYLSYYPDLIRATSDDASPTPGYLLHKIAEMTVTSPAQAPKLVDFLVTRLQTASSPTIKLKTLRLMLYCVRHGGAEFGRLLRSRDGDIAAASAAAGPADPALGMTPHLWVRSTSQELLSLLFSGGGEVQERTPHSSLGGLGSAAASGGRGQLQGFGASSARQTGVAGLPGRLRELVEGALSPTAGPPPADPLITPAGEYEPPPRLSATVAGPETPGPLRQLAARPPRARGHVPGRAGGGWEDSDEETVDADDVSVGSDVAAAINESDEVPARVSPPVSEEVLAVQQYCSEAHGPPRSLLTAVQLADRLVARGNSDVTAALVDQLSRPSDVSRLRALVLLDCLLQAGPTAADSGAALAAAVTALTAAGGEPVRIKAVKVGRILAQLTA